MGLVTEYPAVRISDPAVRVPVWNGSHRIVGYLGPDDHHHSAAVNVTCTITRCNGSWYKLLNAASFNSVRAYVSTGLTYIMYPGPEGYVLGPCAGNTDRPGPRRWPCWVAAVGTGLVLAALAGRLAARRHRPELSDAEQAQSLPGVGP